jgi:tetratricopeptide (TPR) repeat protein
VIVTFYSYKGGVGRSMALVNVAELLADAGYRVVVCDFDLEAPGLERYFADDPELLERYRSRPGIIDLLDEYKTALAGGDGNGKQPDDPRATSLNGLRVPRPSGYLVDIPSRNPRRRGSVSLLTAGRRDGSWNQRYSERVQQFDWDDFYAAWAGDVYLDLFRKDLMDGGAVVLVDSRTGITEQGGVCTHHLADLVVLLSAANDLNVAGTKWMAEVLSSDEVASMRRGRPLRVMPVAARIEVFSQVEELESFRSRFQDTFGVHVPPEAGHPATFLIESEIPYVPFYAFTERIVTRQHEVVQREMYDAYAALTRAIVKVGVAGQLLKPPTAPEWRDVVPEQPATVDGLDTDLLEHGQWLASGGTLGRRAVLRGAVLRRRQLPAVNLRGADLAEADLEHANLRGADLRGATLSSARLGSADLAEATLDEADLTDADLTAAGLVGATLRRAGLQNADLRRADLGGADLREADLTRALLDGADLRGTKLDSAIGLTREHLQSALTDDATSSGVAQRIASGLEREREPEQPTVAVRRARFINPPPVMPPTWFQDRHLETKLLADFLADDGLRLMTVVGRGGVGKTVMVCRLLIALQDGQLPDDLGPLEVGGVVFLSPVGAHKVSFPNLFADLTRLLPEDAAQRLEQMYQDPQQSTRDQTLALLEALPTGRTVVLLDNFEDVVDPGTLAITDPQLDEALQTVLTAPGHGLKIILTTRVVPPALLLVQPALQRRLNLDEGLQSPFAENILRAMDADGTLGLRSATDAQLDAVRQHTRGYPRALEALAAILAADRDTSLSELLAEPGPLQSDNVVEALVGEAFSRLDPLAQQVMQALAIYGRPVPPVALDFLLQPYRVAIDSAPVLSRLVNMQFVRRDAGRYYLHQVDRDYALSRISEGEPADRTATEPRFTRYALLARGAEYFAQTRTPPETWKQLDDLEPQLAEFELRYQGEDYDTAASVLLDIDFNYLLLWGHYRLLVELHERLQDKLSDPYIEQASTGNLGIALYSMGRYREAIARHEEALAIARDIGDRGGEAAWLGNLGTSYATLGETRRAIDFYQQALAITRDIGNRGSEGVWLGNLAGSYATLGETRQAIDLTEQALAIARDIGDRRSEAIHLKKLGDCYADDEEWEQAIQHYDEAIRIADEDGFIQGQSEARHGLAKVHLFLGELSKAQHVAEIARMHDYPLDKADIAATLGVILVRQGDLEQARPVLSEAIVQADILLEHTSENYRALDAKALGLSGLGVLGDAPRISEATFAIQAARDVNRDTGVVKGVLRLLDALAGADEVSMLAPVRAAAALEPGK